MHKRKSYIDELIFGIPPAITPICQPLTIMKIHKTSASSRYNIDFLKVQIQNTVCVNFGFKENKCSVLVVNFYNREGHVR